MPLRKRRLTCLFAAIACAPAGCSVTPNYQHQHFQYTRVDVVAVLPAIDNRAEGAADGSFTEFAPTIQKTVVEGLESKGFEAKLTTDVGTVPSLTANDLDVAESSWVKGLGPSHYGWVFVPVLQNAGYVAHIGKSTRATVSGYLFNKSTGELWWQHNGVGGQTSGWVLASINTVGSAVGLAAKGLLDALPKNPKETVTPPPNLAPALKPAEKKAMQKAKA